MQTRLAAAADKSVALTESAARMDAALHEAQSAASRAALAQARLEQEKAILEKSNAWLTQVCALPGCRRRCCCVHAVLLPSWLVVMPPARHAVHAFTA